MTAIRVGAHIHGGLLAMIKIPHFHLPRALSVNGQDDWPDSPYYPSTRRACAVFGISPPEYFRERCSKGVSKYKAVYKYVH